MRCMKDPEEMASANAARCGQTTIRGRDPLMDVARKHEDRSKSRDANTITREMNYGNEQSTTFANDMRLLKTECEEAGLGNEFSRIMEHLTAQRRSEAIEGQAPASAHGPQEVIYKAPPPVSAGQDAGTQPAMFQGLAHANHPIPSTPYNAPLARSSAAQTHQEQLTAAQMAQISQCSFIGNQITHPGVMNHQAHLIPTISNVGVAPILGRSHRK